MQVNFPHLTPQACRLRSWTFWGDASTYRSRLAIGKCMDLLSWSLVTGPRGPSLGGREAPVAETRVRHASSDCPQSY